MHARGVRGKTYAEELPCLACLGTSTQWFRCVQTSESFEERNGLPFDLDTARNLHSSIDNNRPSEPCCRLRSIEGIQTIQIAAFSNGIWWDICVIGDLSSRLLTPADGRRGVTFGENVYSSPDVDFGEDVGCMPEGCDDDLDLGYEVPFEFGNADDVSGSL